MTSLPIQRLSESTINQIAAGEVIERPSGVVRELIENSIDAGAKNIFIKINYDDLSFTIKDDGSGITKNQILKAFDRHSTSKIANFEDIISINTLGFRGEALSSIAAISKVVLTTSSDLSGLGNQVVLSGGKKNSFTSISWQRGTEIKINNLFFNTPVRKNFFNHPSSSFYEKGNQPFILKTRERKAIKEEVINHILTSDEIHYNFITVNRGVEKREINIPSTFSFKDKILHFFQTRDRNHTLEQTLISVNEEIDGFKIMGFITNFFCREKRNNKQYLFIRNRVVRDPYFIKSIQSAYLHKIPSGSHPICFLKVSLTNMDVDINIHPRKEQVKFKDPNLFFKVIQLSIKNTLSRHHFKSSDITFKELSNSPVWSVEEIPTKTINFKNAFNKNPVEDRQKYLHFDNSQNKKPSNSLLEEINTSTFSSSSSPSFTVLGQVAKCYILFIVGNDLFITDQHATHERINFDLINDSLKQKNDQQILLIPLLVDKSSLEIDRILAQKNNIEKFGFELERFGETTLKISKVPYFLPNKKIEMVIEDLLEVTAQHKLSNASEFLGKITARMACRMSVMAGDILTNYEMKELIKEIYEKNYVYTCPHGRPFVKKISEKELEHFFDRNRHII